LKEIPPPSQTFTPSAVLYEELLVDLLWACDTDTTDTKRSSTKNFLITWLF